MGAVIDGIGHQPGMQITQRAIRSGINHRILEEAAGIGQFGRVG